jgi:hypothetical protein
MSDALLTDTRGFALPAVPHRIPRKNEARKLVFRDIAPEVG